MLNKANKVEVHLVCSIVSAAYMAYHMISVYHAGYMICNFLDQEKMNSMMKLFILFGVVMKQTIAVLEISPFARK